MGWVVPSNPSRTRDARDGAHSNANMAKRMHTEKDTNENSNTKSSVRQNTDIQVYSKVTQPLTSRNHTSIAASTPITSLAWSLPPQTKFVTTLGTKTNQPRAQSTAAPPSNGSASTNDVPRRPQPPAPVKTVGWVASKVTRRKAQPTTDGEVKGESANDAPGDAARSKREPAVMWIGGSKWIVPPPCLSTKIVPQNTDKLTVTKTKTKHKAQRNPLSHRDTNADPTQALVCVDDGVSKQSISATCSTLLPTSVPGWVASTAKLPNRKLELNTRDTEGDKQNLSATKYPGESLSLSSLKDGWVARRVKGSNRKYYFHRNLNKSIWQRPHNVWVAYQGKVDGQRRVYFHHSGTGERSWTRPAAFAST